MMKFSHQEDMLLLIKSCIKDLYGKNVEDPNDNLYDAPYFLNAYDIVYIIIYVLNKMGDIRHIFLYEKAKNQTFFSLKSITDFLTTV